MGGKAASFSRAALSSSATTPSRWGRSEIRVLRKDTPSRSADGAGSSRTSGPAGERGGSETSTTPVPLRLSSTWTTKLAPPNPKALIWSRRG